MRTGRHQNQDVFAPFESLDVIKIRTSLTYHPPIAKPSKTSQPVAVPIKGQRRQG